MENDYYQADYEDTGDENINRILEQRNRRKKNQRNATNAFRARMAAAEISKLREQQLEQKKARRQSFEKLIENFETSIEPAAFEPMTDTIEDSIDSAAFEILTDTLEDSDSLTDSSETERAGMFLYNAFL